MAVGGSPPYIFRLWGKNSDCCLGICTKYQFRVFSLLGDPEWSSEWGSSRGLTPWFYWETSMRMWAMMETPGEA